MVKSKNFPVTQVSLVRLRIALWGLLMDIAHEKYWKAKDDQKSIK